MSRENRVDSIDIIKGIIIIGVVFFHTHFYHLHAAPWWITALMVNAPFFFMSGLFFKDFRIPGGV